MPGLPNNAQDPVLDTIKDRLNYGEKDPQAKFHIYTNAQSGFQAGSMAFSAVATLAVSQEQGFQNFQHQVQQVPNRFILQAQQATAPGQLIHLETSQATDVKNVINTEASAIGHDLTGLTKDEKDFRKYAAEILQGLTSQQWPRPELAQLLLRMQAQYNNDPKLLQDLVSYVAAPQRFQLHEAKSALRLKAHLTNVASNINSASASALSRQVTEARGEYAATKVVLTLFHSQQFQQLLGVTSSLKMKIGKASQGSQNGIDQIWAERDGLGNIVRYYIVEAKGSQSATLGFTQTTGYQMSFRWLFYSLVMMWRGDGRYMDVNAPNQKNTAKKILDAMFDDDRRIKVVGVKVKSLYGGTGFQNVVEVVYYGEYNAPEVAQQLIIEKAEAILGQLPPYSQQDIQIMQAAALYLQKIVEIEQRRQQQKALEGVCTELLKNPQLLEGFVLTLVRSLLPPSPPQTFPQQQPATFHAQVKTLFPDRRYGFAVDIYGNRFFLHANDFRSQDGWRFVRVGDNVEFTPSSTPPPNPQVAWRATDIRLVF